MSCCSKASHEALESHPNTQPQNPKQISTQGKGISSALKEETVEKIPEFRGGQPSAEAYGSTQMVAETQRRTPRVPGGWLDMAYLRISAMPRSDRGRRRRRRRHGLQSQSSGSWKLQDSRGDLGIFVCAARCLTGFEDTAPSDWNICCDGGECDEWEKVEEKIAVVSRREGGGGGGWEGG
jgi:hypothetical protein